MSYPKVPIGELVSLRQGFAINKNTKHHISDEPTALPLLRIADMKDKVQNVFVKDTIPAHFIARPEDIIYTRTGQVGLVFTDQHGVIHNNCFTVTPNDAETLDRYYLYYVLQSEDFYTAANNLASGAAQPDLPHGAFRSIEIPVPQISSQQRIAQILKGYDDLIENNQKQIKLLEEAAQRLYKEWFVDLRFPGHKTTPIIDGIPEGWTEKTIHDVCTKVGAGGTPSRSNATYWNPSSIKWFKTGELMDCWLLDSMEKISEEGLAHSSAKLFPPNTILMAIYASPTLGRLGILTTEATCNQAALCLMANESIISWQWLYQKLYELREEFNAVAKGAGQQNISADVVKKKSIIVPSKKSIDQYTSIAAPMFDSMRTLQEQNAQLQEARNRLLPKLMNGEIEV